MIKIAIVEDTPAEAQTLSDSVAAFFKKEGAAFECTVYGDAMSFLTGYKSVYDMVFMDIELPLLDGMTAAEKLRKFDKKILLIFVTNMAQFAVKGYAVDAFDYIVKPVRYQNFEMKMKKALARIRAEMDAIVVAKPGGMIRVRTRYPLHRGARPQHHLPYRRGRDRGQQHLACLAGRAAGPFRLFALQQMLPRQLQAHSGGAGQHRHRIRRRRIADQPPA